MKNGSRFRASILARMPIAWLFLLLLAGAPSLFGQQKGLSPEKRATIEKAVSSFMSANTVPGVGAAVVLHGEPAWSAGFGIPVLEDYAPSLSQLLR